MKFIRYGEETAPGAAAALFVAPAKAKAFFSERLPEANELFARIYKNPTGRMELTESGGYMLLLTVPKLFDAAAAGRILVYTDFDKTFVLSAEETAYGLLAPRMSEARSFAGLLCLLLDALTTDDYLALEELEKSVNLLEERLIEDKAPDNTVGVIVNYRKRLMRFKQFYEQLLELLDGFNGNKISLTGKDKALYVNLVGRLTRLLGRVRDLRDGVSQVREAYQAQVDIGQNRLMKLFTVITAIFMPLQLIVGWYGMNLVMPETRFFATYFIVIAVSALVVVTLILIMKKRRWFQ